MTQVNAQVLNAEQTTRATALFNTALAGYLKEFYTKNGRQANEGEVDLFTDKTKASIVASILKSDKANDKAKRASRLKAVDALAAANGVKFFHRREVEEIEVDSEIIQSDRKGFIDQVEYEIVNATRGGQTFAFKYKLNDKNELGMVYATAFCRDDENFDPLIGKEIALQKFLLGQVVSAQITHEPFGEVKLQQLAKKYKGTTDFSAPVRAQGYAFSNPVGRLVEDPEDIADFLEEISRDVDLGVTTS